MPAIYAALLSLLLIPDPSPPPVELADGDRFGLTLAQVQECRRFNRACHDHADAQRYLAPTDALREHWRAVADDLQSRWCDYDLLADALGETHGGSGGEGEYLDGEAWRLHCLGRLRDRLGIQAWGEGRLPDHVNPAHFREIP